MSIFNSRPQNSFAHRLLEDAEALVVLLTALGVFSGLLLVIGAICLTR